MIINQRKIIWKDDRNLFFLCDRNLAMMVITLIEVSFTHSSGDSNMQIQINLVYV